MISPEQERSDDCGLRHPAGARDCGLTSSIQNPNSASRNARLRRFVLCACSWILAGVAGGTPSVSAQTPLQDLFNRVQQRNAQIEEQQNAPSGPAASEAQAPT